MKLFRTIAALGVALALAACSGSQFDRDAGACLILSKQGGACTVTLPAPPAEPRP